MTLRPCSTVSFFFFNDTATTEIYTLSYTTLFRSRHRAPGSGTPYRHPAKEGGAGSSRAHHSGRRATVHRGDRKSTRLNSSHSQISYAVFCLKKKKTKAPRRI